MEEGGDFFLGAIRQNVCINMGRERERERGGRGK